MTSWAMHDWRGAKWWRHAVEGERAREGRPAKENGLRAPDPKRRLEEEVEGLSIRLQGSATVKGHGVFKRARIWRAGSIGPGRRRTRPWAGKMRSHRASGSSQGGGYGMAI
ncbi:hypothetical protein GOP47_0017382 [Adiantum capillus-veneris]|uniref:Uncharacterized protein n=1 Tax=Adiantum capillus-veneris TaxID=13818 RepID=A0A9D4UGA8_ADICA|nr:hypothetical protein GOP47_0017382 [Adiantum capillus-veneris]